MDKKYVDIIYDLVDGVSISSIENKLKKMKGYNPNTVPLVYSWLVEKMIKNKVVEMLPYREKSHRILSEDEIIILGKKNYDKLIKLYANGILSNQDIQFITTVFGEMDLDYIEHDFDLLLLSVLIGNEAYLNQGSRLSLLFNDKIN